MSLSVPHSSPSGRTEKVSPSIKRWEFPQRFLSFCWNCIINYRAGLQIGLVLFILWYQIQALSTQYSPARCNTEYTTILQMGRLWLLGSYSLFDPLPLVIQHWVTNSHALCLKIILSIKPNLPLLLSRGREESISTWTASTFCRPAHVSAKMWYHWIKNSARRGN